jgi:hypothetical protein
MAPSPPDVVLRVGLRHATDTLVYVGVVTDIFIRKSNAKAGSQYGMPYGYVLGTKHLINISNLENVQPPSTSHNSIYWQRWINFKMTDECLEDLKRDIH